MLRYKTKTRPGLVALYDIQPGNGAGPFLQPRSPHGAITDESTSSLSADYFYWRSSHLSQFFVLALQPFALTLSLLYSSTENAFRLMSHVQNVTISASCAVLSAAGWLTLIAADTKYPTLSSHRLQPTFLVLNCFLDNNPLY